MKVIDFRSDTVTKPSPEMWETVKSMDNSHLGDDVEREDPTVNELEARAAKIFGKEGSLFVTSGTQGNLLALLAQTTPGDEILIEERSHIYKWEVAGAARLGGLMVRTFPSEKGRFSPDSLQYLIHDDADVHEATSRLIAIENTHNFHGGVVLPPSLFASTRNFAQKNGLKVHVDGARIFNAAVAHNVSVSDFSQYADTVQFCLSKGLCCPIGSMIVGSTEFIERARKLRKMVGGGWRQAGIIASMGLVALEDKWIARLAEDHKRCLRLAEDLQNFDLPIQVQPPETNILMVHLPDSADMHKIVSKLDEAGIRVFNMGQKIRFVTHYWIDDNHIAETSERVYSVLKEHL